MSNEKVCRLFTGTSFTIINLLINMSSDFISKGRKWFAFPNFFWNRIPKVCSVVHETIFHVIVCFLTCIWNRFVSASALE